MKASDDTLALFIMLGRTVEKLIQDNPETVPPESLEISDTVDLSTALPKLVWRSNRAALVYKLFFVFENYLRDLVLEILSEKHGEKWWEKVPSNVQTDVADLEQTEETKKWMAVGSRDKLSLTTYNQLLQIINDCWKEGFDSIIRDKGLIQEARLIAHIRNAICHMTDVPDEEIERVKQVLRDWFRIVSP
jgi:hypothetical protein